MAKQFWYNTKWKYEEKPESNELRKQTTDELMSKFNIERYIYSATKWCAILS